MKKMIGVGILAGVLMVIAGFIINIIFQMIYPGAQAFYSNTAIFLPWDDLRMWLFWLYPVVLGIGLAWTYGMLSKKGKEPLTFAGIYFVIGALPTFFINYGSFNFPFMMILSWTLMATANGLIAGFLFGKMLK